MACSSLRRSLARVENAGSVSSRLAASRTASAVTSPGSRNSPAPEAADPRALPNWSAAWGSPARVTHAVRQRRWTPAGHDRQAPRVLRPGPSSAVDHDVEIRNPTMTVFPTRARRVEIDVARPAPLSDEAQAPGHLKWRLALSVPLCKPRSPTEPQADDPTECTGLLTRTMYS